jgi:acyl-homoserine-lactone acylase
MTQNRLFLSNSTSLTLLLILLNVSSIFSQQRNYKEHVTIVRDEWGIPHIYGQKDADVAYGLAWCNAEDDFATMQESLLPAKGLLAKWKGKDGATIDFVVGLVGSREKVDSLYDSQISPEFKMYLEGYCAGVNDYAATHPKEVKVKKAFPITPKDVIVTFHYISALITAVPDQLKAVMNGKYDSVAVTFASNAFAFNPLKANDGKTLLTVNPHMRFEGWFSWYEAHLVSEEGMDIMGALFHGGTSIFVGTNQNLGWTHTWNKYDMADTYKLKMITNKKGWYEYDGKEYQLEKNDIKLKVKLKPWLPTITIKREAYKSILGPVMKSPSKDYYAFRWGAMDEVRTPEQWWRMNKATNFEEYYKILQMNALPRFNIVYADKESNIFFIDNGRVPKRNSDYDWKGVVPGNTSATMWTEVYKTDELPQVKNPDCGYVFNTNNTPYSATCDEDRIAPGTWDPHMNFRVGDNNRSLRFMELVEENERMDFEIMKRIKFDSHYPKDGKFLRSISLMKEIDEKKYPDIQPILKEMKAWDRTANPESLGATYFLVSFDYLFNLMKLDVECFIDGIPLTEEKLVEAVRHTKQHLEKYFKTINVPLKDIFRIGRGDEEYPMPGFPDALAANYAKSRKSDGKFMGNLGDTYTMFVQYGKNGVERVESLVNFGSSAHPESKHYTDQLKIWIKQQTKVMTFDKETILKNAERVYKPGN